MDTDTEGSESHDATDVEPASLGAGACRLAHRRKCRPGTAILSAVLPELPAEPALQLPLLLLPAQLLARDEPAMARAAGRPLPAAAGVHGVPRLPRAGLALRAMAEP